jgi:hypothetical protein
VTNDPLPSNPEPEPTKDNSKKNAKKRLTVDDSNLLNHEEESKIFLDDSTKSSSARDNSLKNESNNH